MTTAILLVLSLLRREVRDLVADLYLGLWDALGDAAKAGLPDARDE